MTGITRRMALDVIEDAFTDLVTPRGRGQALGVCGTFYVCGLISEMEWRRYLERIPPEPREGMAPARPPRADAWQTRPKAAPPATGAQTAPFRRSLSPTAEA